jgi:pimeloyl-ACP methyl ester carboxylesterase
MVSPWDFNLQDVRVPVFLWQGGADTDATPAMAYYLVDQIPHAQLNFFEEEGHISLAVRHMSEILNTVVTPA